MHAPPKSDKHFFKTLLTNIATESAGIVICVGVFNVVLDHRMDKTSVKRSKTHLTKIMNAFLKERGMVDVWIEIHPLEKIYTQYSITHDTHFRIDSILMNSWDLCKVIDCQIGLADISDHNAIHLTIQLNSRQKNTTWRLNVSKMNNKIITEQIKMEKKRNIKENDTVKNIQLFFNGKL